MAIEKANPDVAVSGLIPLLDHDVGAVRAATARAFGSVSGASDTTRLIVPLLSDQRRDVRVASIRSLLQLGDDMHADEMLAAANREPFLVRWILRRAIHRA